jgi:hypothetical protein
MKLLAIILPILPAAFAFVAMSNTYAPGVPGSSNGKRSLDIKGTGNIGLEARAETGLICSLNNCYVQGFSNGATGQNEVFEGSGLSPAACKAKCQARSGCLSFALQQDGTGNCYSEQHTVAAEISENCGAPFFFYDVGCAA